MKTLRYIVLALVFTITALITSAFSADLENTLYLDVKSGRVTIKLRPDLAPNHVAQIKKLAREGFYNGVVFHRVIPGFMAQTGDPTGTGTGSSKYPDLEAEFTDTNFARGVLGMARSQNPNSANSQFFIMFAEGAFLNGQYYCIWRSERGHGTY